MLFPSKNINTTEINTTPISHQTLVKNTNILNISCSLSNILKEETISQIDRECKNCVNSIINQIEFDLMVNLNKAHVSSILFKQNQHFKIQNSVVFPLDLSNHDFYFKNICINKSKIFEIFIQTIGQSENEQWKRERKIRLSASMKAHKIKSCKNWSNDGLEQLANTLLLDSNLGKRGNINTKYGQEMEKIALNKFKMLYGKEVLKCGLIIDFSKPWICSSPDGIILNSSGNIDEVLEI